MNYSWQKSLDNQSSLAESNKTEDPFNRCRDWSRSSWDINHVFVFSYVYELPFGRGRQFGRRLVVRRDYARGNRTAHHGVHQSRYRQHGP